MTVYVDDMYRYPMGRRGLAKLSHMIGDSEAELHAMAALIGLPRRQYQAEHYDIAMSKRMMAISAGAVEVTLRQLACMNHRRKVTGFLGEPADAEAWLNDWWAVNIAISLCPRPRAAAARY